MTQLETVISNIERLSHEEQLGLAEWFNRNIVDEWDLQIEADILAGRLDLLGDKAIQNFTNKNRRSQNA
jgi:hypothetical protein